MVSRNTKNDIAECVSQMPEISELPDPGKPWTGNMLYEASVFHFGINQILARWPKKYHHAIAELLRKIARRLEEQ